MVQYEYRKEEEDISITYCTLFLILPLPMIYWKPIQLLFV